MTTVKGFIEISTAPEQEQAPRRYQELFGGDIDRARSMVVEADTWLDNYEGSLSDTEALNEAIAAETGVDIDLLRLVDRIIGRSQLTTPEDYADS